MKLDGGIEVEVSFCGFFVIACSIIMCYTVITVSQIVGIRAILFCCIGLSPAAFNTYQYLIGQCRKQEQMIGIMNSLEIRDLPLFVVARICTDYALPI